MERATRSAARRRRVEAPLPPGPDLSQKCARISGRSECPRLFTRGCHAVSYACRAIPAFVAARPSPFPARGRCEPRPRRRAGARVGGIRPGALAGRRSVFARRRLGRTATRRLRAVDAPRTRSALARSGDAGRHDRRRRAGDLRDRIRPADARHRAPRHRDRGSPTTPIPSTPTSAACRRAARGGTGS